MVTRPAWIVFGGATVLAVFLHVYYLFHGAGLWRDEVSSLNLATLPTLGQMWQVLDSPTLFPVALRAWCALGLGHSDLGLRILGCVIGILLVGALWLNARIMGFRIPYVSLGLLGTSMTLVRWGDSLRAYGAGCLFMLLTVGQLWAFILQPSRKRFLFACGAAILSVQCLYQNAVLLAAVCAAGCLVCLARKNPRTAGLIVLVGLSAAVSLAPYLPHLAHSRSAWRVLRVGFNERLLWANLSEALGSPLLELRWIWLLLILAAGAIGVASLDHQNRVRRIGAANLSLYGATAAAVGILGFFLFLILAKLPTQSWYYLPLMAFVAACLDAALVQWLTRRPIWWAWFTGFMVVVSLPFAIRQANDRQTNIDVIVSWLNQRAQPKDFIIVYPWYCGVTFNHYYHGPAAWTTLPGLADHRFHRYDLLEEKLAAANPIQDVLDRALSTVADGHVLWIVGRLPNPAPDETQPPILPPAPDAPTGWADEPYTYVWGRQTEYFLRTHLGRIEPVTVGPEKGVFWCEDSALFRAGGLEAELPSK